MAKRKTHRKTNRGLTLVGWGIIGEPQEGILRSGPEPGPHIDVTGSNEGDWWGGDGFLGPDPYGITPIYHDRQGRQFPREAREYPYLC